MKTYSQRHNAEQAVVSALKRLEVENIPGVSYLFAVRPDNRMHPVVYLDPKLLKIDPAKRLKTEMTLSNSGFTVMIGSLPEQLAA